MKVAFRVLIAGSVLALVLDAILALVPISSEALTLSTGSLPSVSTPSVTIPSVTVPSVSTPSVTIPSLTVPSVSTPSVTIPSVTVPSVSTPSVSTSSVTAPSGSMHSLATSSEGSPAATSSPGTAGAGAPSSSGSDSPSSGSGAAPMATPSASQLAFLGRSGNGSEQAATSGAAGRGADTTKYLRRLVDQLSGCLSALAPQAQRVLVLRAGIGTAHSYTPSQVAAMLHISVAYEGKVQRAGVTALQTAAQDGTCGAAPGSIPVSALPLAQGELVTIAGPQPGTAEFASAAKTFAASHSNLPARLKTRSPRSSRTAASGIPSKAIPPIQKAELSRSSTSVGAWTFGVLALLAVLAMMLIARRRLGQAQPAPAASAVAPTEASLGSHPAPEATMATRQELLPLAPTSTAGGLTAGPEAWLPLGWSHTHASTPPGASEAPSGVDGQDQPATTTPSPDAARPSWLAGHRSGVLVTLMAASGTLRLLIRARRPRRRHH